jgi:hypothetical protein
MDYYQPPTDHPNALEMERLQEQLDALIKQRQHLETLDFTQRQSKSNTPPSRSKSASCAVSPRRSNMDDTQDLHHQRSSMSKSRL